jgi:hypothetical protein
MRNYAMRGNLGRYKKLETEAQSFVTACRTNTSLDAETILNHLIFRACPNIASRDQETPHRVVGWASGKKP